MKGRRHWLVALVAVAATCLTAVAASAQGGLPTQPAAGSPVPPPSTGTPGVSVTALPPRPVGPYLFDISGSVSPFDFIFRDQLGGNSFQPGEVITITVDNAAVSPVTVSADSSGSFVVNVEYTWVFCGVNATGHPAPVFHARGNEGSSAELSKPVRPCPDLESLQQQPPMPTLGPGEGGTAVAGTAVAGTAIVITAQPNGTPPPSTPGTPRPWPAPVPFLLTFTAWGFGFVPGERVTVQEIQFPGNVAPPSVQATGDGLGRIRLSLQAYVARCTPLPHLVARGDKGTTVIAPLNWRDLIMAPCPVYGGEPPTGTTVTSTVPAAVPTATTAGPMPRSLRFVAVPGYQMGVAGHRWGRHSRLSFVLREETQAGWVRSSVVLQARPSGSFLVGVSNVRSCGIQVTVRDAMGHVVRLRTLPSRCDVGGNAPRPVLRVLKGKRLA